MSEEIQGADLLAAFQRLNELKAGRDKTARHLELLKSKIASTEEEIATLKEHYGVNRKDRASKEEMTAIRAKLRVVLREAQGEPMYPSQIAEDAELSDIDQVRRVLREMVQTDGPVKNIQESRRESQYYWDTTWRSPSLDPHG
jgi:ribosomal protein S15P/S13E